MLKSLLLIVYGRHHELFDVQNIHMSISLLLRRFVLLSITSSIFTGLDYEYNNDCLIRSVECLPFASGSFFISLLWSACQILSIFCVVFFVLFVFVLCLLSTVSGISGLTIIDCPSVFSNIHLKLTAFAKKNQNYIYLQVIFRVLLISCMYLRIQEIKSILNVLYHNQSNGSKCVIDVCRT